VKIVYGYQKDGSFLLATVGDDSLSEHTDEIKQTIDSVQLEGEAYVEISRADCQTVAKHMQFGRKGDIRIMDPKSAKMGDPARKHNVRSGLVIDA
jgi:hypothetical protein